LFIVLVLGSGNSSAQVELQKLDQYLEKSAQAWGVPAMSVAIVKDGRIVFEKGYGVLEVGKPNKTNEHTLYAIASNTKAFTAAAMARLVQAGKLSWQDKVIDHLPYFRMYDEYVTQHTNIEDILSHRVGLGTFSGDVVWDASTFTSEEIIRRIQYLPQAYPFRGGFGYSNMMYITAGEVIHKVSDKPWGEYVREQFLTPLGMSRTITSLKALKEKSNYATPHAFRDNGKNEPIVWTDWEQVIPKPNMI